MDRYRDVLEVLTARMARLENNVETPAELQSKDQQSLKRDYDLVEFAINSTVDFKKAVKKTKGLCISFFRRLLVTYNRCQIEAEQRIDAFLDHNAFVELLQKKYQEEEANMQHLIALDEQIMRNKVDHSAVSV